jgi:hypothetical protein
VRRAFAVIADFQGKNAIFNPHLHFDLRCAGMFDGVLNGFLSYTI